jgi:hypothetical protein
VKNGKEVVLAEIFDNSMDEIRQNRLKRESGLVTTIPFGLPRLEEFVPGIQRKNYTILTASSGIGKSKLCKFLYVINAVNFILANPQMNIKLKIFYFCLEESKRAFIQSIKAYKLWQVYGKRIDVKHMRSMTKTLDSETEGQLMSLRPWFEKFEEIVEVIDWIRKPYPIYHHVEEYLLANGSWSFKEIPITVNEKVEIKKVRNFYTPNHPDTYVEVITDHLSLLQPEKSMKGKHEAITIYSSEYCINLRDKYYCTIINVQQQMAEQEKKQFTYKGNSIDTKLEPTLDGLADNKLTQRDADEVLGLFAPDRYEIDEHRGYNIRTLEDNYRSLSVLKMRDGMPNTRIGLFFDGAVNYIQELPKKDEMNPQVYNELLSRVGRYNPPGTYNFG